MDDKKRRVSGDGIGLPKKGLSPAQIFSRSLKQIGAAKTLDDLVLAAYVGAGCADALLLSGLIDIEEYHEQNKEIVHVTTTLREQLEAEDGQSN